MRKTGIQECKITYGDISIHLVQVSHQLSARTKWMHQFENATSIVFAVDLSCYNKPSLNPSSSNRLKESMRLFQSISEARWFVGKSAILLLCNVQRFQQKLAYSPLRNYLRNFHGPNEFSDAMEYIIQRFRGVSSFMHFLSLVCKDEAALDASVIHDFIVRVGDIIFKTILRNWGIM